MEKFQSCKNYAEGATIDAFIPTTDLTALAQADRLEIAREADTGEITVEEADEKMAELGVQLDQIYNARMIQNQQLESERLNALSNILAATRPPPPVTIP